MCEHARHRRFFGESREDYDLRCEKLVRLFACRTKCAECAQACAATIYSLMKAERATCDRQMLVTLTFDDAKLAYFADSPALAGLSASPAGSIDAAIKLMPDFFGRLRIWLRRRWPDYEISVRYFYIGEYGAERGRAHVHCILYFEVNWRDADRRLGQVKPEWNDGFLPNLEFGRDCFILVLESEEEAFQRTGRKNYNTFPSRIPWPWGFSYWQNCGGGEATYVTKYVIKAVTDWIDIRNRIDANDGNARHDDRMLLCRTIESASSRRHSPRFGHRFIRQVFRRMAEQGLPARMYFQVPMGAKAIPGTRLIDGSANRRILKASYDYDAGRIWLREKIKPRESVDFLLTGSASCAAIEEYDDTWAEVHGSAPMPSGPTTRTVVRNTAVKPITETVTIMSTPEMARERALKLRERRFIDARRRRGLVGTVAEDVYWRFPKGIPVFSHGCNASRGGALREPAWRDLPWAVRDRDALVNAWVAKFRREVVGAIRGSDRFDKALPLLGDWLRGQPALDHFTEAEICDLQFAVIARLDPGLVFEVKHERAAVWRPYPVAAGLGAHAKNIGRIERRFVTPPPLPSWMRQGGG